MKNIPVLYQKVIYIEIETKELVKYLSIYRNHFRYQVHVKNLYVIFINMCGAEMTNLINIFEHTIG